MKNKTLIVSFGGGTNSTGMLVGLLEHGERPDAIWFADTGGEKPHTYTHIAEVSAWCLSVGFPAIEVLRGPAVWGPQMVKDGSLEAECLRLGTLPSKAFGFSQCSIKWKLEPAKRRLRLFLDEHYGVIAHEDVVRCVGFDAGEPHRYERAKGIMERNPALTRERWPLIEWDWGREECVAAIERAGLNQPGKSACFFCPSSKKPELVHLKATDPGLVSRAVEMERKAMAGEGQATAARCGLGRSFVWGDFLRDPLVDTGSDAGVPEIDCGCYD